MIDDLRSLARILLGCLLAACVLPVPAPAAGAEPAGMVTDLQGSASQSGGSRLAILTELGAGARLEVGTGAKVTVAHFASGRQFDLEGPGSFRLTTTGIENVNGGRVTPRAPLGAAYQQVRLRPARVAQASISMRGSPEDVPLQLVSPVGTWVLENRPVFRWQALAGASSYRFELTDNVGRTLYETSTNETMTKLPESIALQAGQTYAWQVESKLPDGRTADGWTEFGIADADRRRRAMAARPATEAPFADRVLYAMLLDDIGLREDATAVWGALARERPADPRLRALSTTR